MRLALGWLGGGLLAAALSGPARASDQPALTVQLNGPFGAPFAGYFVADFQGYYDEAEVAVTLVPGAGDVAPAQALADGAANVVIERMPAALAARERGVPLVNIGQFFVRPALEVVCRADRGVTAPAQLRGRRLGVWADGDRPAMLAWLAGQGLAGEVTLLAQGHDPALLAAGQADCIAALSWDERAQLVDAGVAPEELVVIPLAEHGPAALEDGIWVPETLLASRHGVVALAGFLHASRRGWSWARRNPIEAVRIVQEYDADQVLEEKPQVRRMHEINRLTAGTGGMLDPQAYQTTVDLLLAAGVIDRAPVGAWSHVAARAAGLDEPE